MPAAFERLLDFFTAFLGREICMAIIVFVLFLAGGKILLKYLFRFIRKLSGKIKTDFEFSMLPALERPLGIFIVILGLYFALKYLPLTSFQNMFVLKTFRATVIVFVAWCFYNLTGTFLFTGLGRKLEIEIDQILLPFLIKHRFSRNIIG